jgi:hypothetical protein
MTIIQVILFIAVFALLLLYFKLFKNRILQRIFFLIVFLSGIIAVALPNVTNKLAKLVGVGRGADLLLYLMVIIFYFAFILVYRKVEEIRERQTEIIRYITLQNAINNNDED